MRFIFILFIFVFSSCDSSIKDLNEGFSDGYKAGLKSNGCKNYKDRNRQWKSKFFKDGFLKGFDAGVIDCIKTMKETQLNN